MGRNRHVERTGHQWGVRGEGNLRLTSVHSRQSDAIDAARDIARTQQTEFLIHDRQNRIRERNRYGNDRCPPRG